MAFLLQQSMLDETSLLYITESLGYCKQVQGILCRDNLSFYFICYIIKTKVQINILCKFLSAFLRVLKAFNENKISKLSERVLQSKLHINQFVLMIV